ncbi:hypothetical protein SCUP234_03022 [Seiridium cupressi]
MHLITLLSYLPPLLGILSRGTAVAEPTGEMELYLPSGGGSLLDKAKNSPTWLAQYRAEDTGLQNPETYETNAALAKSHFDWLVSSNNKNQRNLYGETGWLVVAVMYDPESKWHWASTIPRGTRSEMMWSKFGRNAAPVWYAAAKPPDKGIETHAEDGCYFNWEIARNAAQKPYPQGMVIATYGHQETLDNDHKTIWGPDDLPSCSDSNNRKQPSCQKVAETLGVQCKKVPDADAQQAAAASAPVDDEYGDLTQEELDEMCQMDLTQRRHVAIKGREVELERRDGCNLPLPYKTFSYDKSTTSNTQSKPSCTMQNEDPDQGINTEYCVCDKTRTLPFLTITPEVVRTKSCDYTTLPPKDTKRAAMPSITPPVATITPAATIEQRDLTISTGFGPPTTDSKHCQVCTRVVNNEDSCSSMKDCIVQTGAVTIEAGTSSVHVGTLTGTALYTSVSSALEKICPSPTGSSFTSCKTDTVSIEEIPFVEMDYLSNKGELQVSVESSTYNISSIRDALIKAAAAAAQQAATGKNCYEQKYLVSSLGARSWLGSLVPSFMRRSDIQPPEEEKATWCNTVGFSGPQYYNPWWRLQSQPGASDYMDVHFQFHEAGGGDFDCAILEVAAGALAFLGPEFAIGDIGIEEAIGIACEAATGSNRRDVNSTLLEIGV